MNALLIARVSTDDQVDALPAQKYRLEDYAKRQGYTFEVIEFQESAYKGDRERFREIVQLIKSSQEPLIVVFDKVDRFSRDVSSDVVREIQDLVKSGRIELHFPSDNLFLNKDAPAVANMQLNMSMSFSQYYSDAISDNVKRKLQQKWRDGEWAGKAPFGYLNVVLPDSKKWIVPDPVNSEVVSQMYSWYCSGVQSMLTIRQKLLENFGIQMNKSQIARILSNPFYYGLMEVKDKTYPHKYETIISEYTFDTAKQIRGGFVKTENRVHWAGLPYKYRGLINCAECGCIITFEMKKGKYLYGHCTQGKGKHGASYVSEEKLTEQFARVFDSIAISDQDFSDAVTTINERKELIQRGKNEQLALISVEKAKYARRLERIYDDLLEDRIDESTYDRKRSEFDKKIETLNRRSRTLELNDDDPLADISYLLELARDSPEIFKAGNLEQKRELIKNSLSNLQLKGKLLRWKLKKPLELMAFCAEKRDWQG